MERNLTAQNPAALKALMEHFQRIEQERQDQESYRFAEESHQIELWQQHYDEQRDLFNEQNH